jgi:hypothetical protein
MARLQRKATIADFTRVVEQTGFWSASRWRIKRARKIRHAKAKVVLASGNRATAFAGISL